ncbi:MAG: IS21 family transposase [Deltaproteobacteria bacterium]|nr:IS21 family transposase [Deltaproteobacteria bacterium]
MSQEILPMNKTKEIFRLHFESKLSNRQIARCHKISRATVQNYLFRFESAGLKWPLSPEIDDLILSGLLYPKKTAGPLTQEYVVPDWAETYRELKRKGVTRYLLWEEYRQALNSEQAGYSYNRFCCLYQEWEKKLGLSMRQTHLAGDKLFVDYSGQTIPILINSKTGETREAQVFVAVMGASSYTYAEATWTQTSSDWIASHTRAFEFFGGVTKLLIPDNLKSGVQKPNLYEPLINRSYEDMATHYNTAVMPARIRRSKDKALAEIGVCVVLRWILAKGEGVRTGHRTIK